MKIDIVVVCFSGDFAGTRLLLRSLAQFGLPDAVGNIFLVVNEPKPDKLLSKLRRIKYEAGFCSQSIELIDGSELARRSWLRWTDRKFGWRQQQVLKLQAHKIVTGAAYLVLDAKNFFIRRPMRSDFLSDSGRLRINMRPINETYSKAFRRALKFFGEHAVQLPDTTVPTITPFLFETAVVRDMVKETERRSGMNFETYFVGRRYTEFYFYAAYLMLMRDGISSTYDERPQVCHSIFRSMYKNSPCVEAQIKALDDHNIYASGIHREVINRGSRDVLNIIEVYLRDIGLLGSIENLSSLGR